MIVYSWILFFFFLFDLEGRNGVKDQPKIVDQTFKTDDCIEHVFSIDIPEYPASFNPSLIEYQGVYILTFRFLPYPDLMPWISYIGLIKLDKNFSRISRPVLLNVRQDEDSAPSQAEDARLFEFRNELYIIYNDNPDILNPKRERDRRDIYIAKIKGLDEEVSVEKPLKLIHPTNYSANLWQKNWSPFVYRDELYVSYSINPHEVLKVDLSTGISTPIHRSKRKISYNKGALRGGTPSILVDGKYFGFFHSNLVMSSLSSNNQEMWHYFMGAYVFDGEPPFKLLHVSEKPLIHKKFYTKDSYAKRVIYPGGYVISGDKIYLAYGKNDKEIGIAVINKVKLYNSLCK